MNILYLKDFREKYNIDRETQAEMLDVTIDTLNNWEYRTKQIPKTKVKHIEYVFNTYISKNSIKEPEAIQVDFTEMNVMFVPLVSKFAYAGYLDNLGDDEYVGELPTVAFANDVQNRGDYLAFEVKGDSMDNGLSNAILEGDILLARNVRQDYWQSKLHIRKWNFIIVHKERGILIKRITKHDTNTNEITIHSLNDYYEDDTIHLKNVQAIYNVVDIKRKPIL